MIFLCKNVLIKKNSYYSLAGISRSTTICIAYVMTILEMPWYDALNAVRGSRKGANPNFGFQRQLQNFEHTNIKKVCLAFLKNNHSSF